MSRHSIFKFPLVPVFIRDKFELLCTTRLSRARRLFIVVLTGVVNESSFLRAVRVNRCPYVYRADHKCLHKHCSNRLSWRPRHCSSHDDGDDVDRTLRRGDPGNAPELADRRLFDANHRRGVVNVPLHSLAGTLGCFSTPPIMRSPVSLFLKGSSGVDPVREQAAARVLVPAIFRRVHIFQIDVATYVDNFSRARVAFCICGMKSCLTCNSLTVYFHFCILGHVFDTVQALRFCDSAVSHRSSAMLSAL